MKIQRFWEKYQLPELLGDICFSNGKMILFKERKCCGRYTYDIIQAENINVPGYDIEIAGRSINPDNKDMVFFGSGDMGNEGFLVYTNRNNDLIWYMFLEYGNPFVDVSFEANRIVAKTEIDYIFSIPFDNPEKMTCESQNPWGY